MAWHRRDKRRTNPAKTSVTRLSATDADWVNGDKREDTKDAGGRTEGVLRMNLRRRSQAWDRSLSCQRWTPER